MADIEHYDVVIIGAGWNGLITASTYLKLAPESKLLIVDDGQSIGGVWSNERIYPNLFAQVGHGLFEYSSYSMKKEGLTSDRYIPGDTIHGYLNDFAKAEDLVRRTRLNTTITKVDKNELGSWQLLQKDSTTLTASKLVVASGASSGPYLPNIPQSEAFETPIIHSSQIGSNLDNLQGPTTQRITVLGAAKSSYDTVFLLLKAGKQVDWIIREDGTGPLAIMPPRLAGLFNTIDIMATRACASASPAILNTKGVWYNVLQKTRLGRVFVKAFWRNLTRIAEYQAGYHKSENAEKLRPIPKGYGIFYANSGLGLASVPDFWKVFHEGGATVHRTEISGFTGVNTVNLKSGLSFRSDFVVLCTGWTHNLGPFSEDLRAEYGLPSKSDFSIKWQKLDAMGATKVDQMLPLLATPPQLTTQESERRPWRLYRRLISPEMSAKGDRSIFFPGQLHSVCTPLVAEMQALWGVAFLLGRFDPPNQDEMEEEVAVWNAWTAKRYLAQGMKHAYSIYDYLAYVDSLARDLGIRTNRKSNLVSEMFAPYRPRDYRGLIDEFLAAESVRASKGRENDQVLANKLKYRDSSSEDGISDKNTTSRQGY